MTVAAATAAPTPARQLSREDWVMRIGISILCVLLVIAIALPLGLLLFKSFQRDGQFVGLANYIVYFSTPRLVASVWNSLFVATTATAVTVPLAFVYAYALTRTCLPSKGIFMALAMLPIFAPSLLSAISFIYIFGNQGFLKELLMGATVYGPIGILLSLVFYCFPFAVLILVTALSLADGRLYEAAAALCTSTWRMFWTVTVPGIKYGLVSACFLVFTLSITDFGIAKVIGGQYDVLATDVYKQVVGQQNFEMGAVIGFVLLVPAVVAFVVDRLIQRKQVALLSARAVPLEPKPVRGRDVAFLAYCCLVGALIVGILGVAVWASFVTYWPYNLSLSLRNYNFNEFDTAGWQTYFNSVKMASLAAVLGTTVVFVGAYLVEKGQGFRIGRSLAHLLAMLPMAVPGLVLGLAYVFFVNAPWNPLNVFYGTILVLAVNTIAHFYTAAHITAVTALKQIDSEFESVSASLKVPFWRTFVRVTVPICMPAILNIAVYMFVNAMTTVSAVIFLYGPYTKLASVSIVHMDEAGFTAGAAGMATLIVITALGVKLLHLALDWLVLGKLQAWRKR